MFFGIKQTKNRFPLKKMVPKSPKSMYTREHRFYGNI